jgi:hypothetical protein
MMIEDAPLAVIVTVTPSDPPAHSMVPTYTPTQSACVQSFCTSSSLSHEVRLSANTAQKANLKKFIYACFMVKNERRR